MSRELDLLAKEYQSKKATVMRKSVSVYRTGITTAASGFLRAVEAECKKQDQANVVLVAIVPEPEEDHTSGYR
jgi:hypothetical protein